MRHASEPFAPVNSYVIVGISPVYQERMRDKILMVQHLTGIPAGRVENPPCVLLA